MQVAWKLSEVMCRFVCNFPLSHACCTGTANSAPREISNANGNKLKNSASDEAQSLPRSQEGFHDYRDLIRTSCSL